MAIFSRRSRSHDSEDTAGWIAMVDVFSLFAVVAIGVGAAQIARLTKQISTMPGDWTSVVKERSDFRDRIQALQTELSELRRDWDRLRVEREKLDRELEDAKNALEAERDSNSKLTAELEKCHEDLSNAEVKIRQLERDLAQATARVNELEADLEALVDQKRALEQQLAEARSALIRARSKLVESLSLLATCVRELKSIQPELMALRGKLGSIGRGEAELRRQLLGLEGDLRRVVFVLDRSGSMDVKDNRTGRNRWQDAISTIEAWLRFLAVDEAGLVVFSGGVDVFPPDGRWVSLSEEGPDPLLKGLDGLSPMGATNTLEALKRAYRYPEVSVIILFTDGAPDSGKDGGVGNADDILRFVASQKTSGIDVRIHTVGVGDYFSPRMRDFLLRLSGETGGTFIGR